MSQAAIRSDIACVERFRALRGRAHRPTPVPTRPRPAAETAAWLALVPHFEFSPLTRLIALAGLPADSDLVELRALEMAEALLVKLRAGTEAEARELIEALGAACGRLVANFPCAGPVDLVAVPGSRTLARGAFATRLFREHGASFLAISGGHPSYADPGEAAAISEAAAYAALARLSGVPAGALLLDHEARSTEQNGLGLAKLVEEAVEQLGRPLHLLLTSSDFHSTRSLLWLKRALAERSKARSGGLVASIGVAPSPCFDPLLLCFDDGGRGPKDKIAIVLNEFLKIDFDLRRERIS